MNSEILKGQWSQLRGSLKSNWSQLTDQDLKEISGQSDLLIGKLQERYGYSKVEAEKKINQFINRFEPSSSYNRKLGNNLKHVGTSLNTSVKNSPWTLALLSSIGGLLIGMALKRRPAKSKFFSR